MLNDGRPNPFCFLMQALFDIPEVSSTPSLCLPHHAVPFSPFTSIAHYSEYWLLYMNRQRQSSYCYSVLQHVLRDPSFTLLSGIKLQNNEENVTFVFLNTRLFKSCDKHVVCNCGLNTSFCDMVS